MAPNIITAHYLWTFSMYSGFFEVISYKISTCNFISFSLTSQGCSHIVFRHGTVSDGQRGEDGSKTVWSPLPATPRPAAHFPRRAPAVPGPPQRWARNAQTQDPAEAGSRPPFQTSHPQLPALHKACSYLNPVSPYAPSGPVGWSTGAGRGAQGITEIRRGSGAASLASDISGAIHSGQGPPSSTAPSARSSLEAKCLQEPQLWVTRQLLSQSLSGNKE